MAFLPPVVGCLVKKGLQKGGHWHALVGPSVHSIKSFFSSSFIVAVTLSWSGNGTLLKFWTTGGAVWLTCNFNLKSFSCLTPSNTLVYFALSSLAMSSWRALQSIGGTPFGPVRRTPNAVTFPRMHSPCLTRIKLVVSWINVQSFP